MNGISEDGWSNPQSHQINPNSQFQFLNEITGFKKLIPEIEFKKWNGIC